MTVIDPSAIVALMTREPGWEVVRGVLEDADQLVLAAPSLVELSIVIEARFGPEGRWMLRRLLDELAVDVEDFDERHATAAFDAWRRFGRGRHPAALTLGDCCSYALAHVRGEPLLFVGDDFAQTDIESATAVGGS